MAISIIAAVAENNVIGKDNDLIWHLPADLKFFKAKTTGHHIIMGRNTFESIGGGRPLPNRTTVIITRQTDFTANGCLVAHSLEQAIELSKADDEIFICGGSQIYNLALEKADQMYLTHIHESFDGDTFFPEFNKDKWKLTEEETHQSDEKNKYSYTFAKYIRQ